jgi:prepilin-type N-terminal cleavage/methylation domain-containing protein
MPFPLCLNVSKAFTLNELLLALAIIGMIAAMVIPNLVKSVDALQNQAKFKDALSIIESLTYEAYQEGKTKVSKWDYFKSRLDISHACENDAVAEGCVADYGFSDAPNIKNRKALVLKNGVVIAGLTTRTFDDDFEHAWLIDANGLQAPNTLGQDVLVFNEPSFTASSYSKIGKHVHGAWMISNNAYYDSLWR